MPEEQRTERPRRRVIETTPERAISHRFALEDELERGWWWSARDRETDRTVLCTIAELTPRERHMLAAVQTLTREWSHVAPLCGLEERFDGKTLVAYATTPGSAYSRAADGPLSAFEVRGLAKILSAVLARAHAAGIVHPGLTTASIGLVIDHEGVMRAHICGLGLPVDPSRGAHDDFLDLAGVLEGLLTERGSSRHRAHAGGGVSERGFISALRALTEYGADYQ